MPVATRFVPDARASHYWDGTGVTMRAYRAVLGIPEEAWDVYLLYGPDARWEGELPPQPAFWMHQLGPRDAPRVPGPFLDPDAFAARADALLGARGRE